MSLEQILDRRTRNFLDKAYGGDLDAVAEHVKMRLVLPCHPSVGGTYTVGGARDAIQWGKYLAPGGSMGTRQHEGTGEKTALRVAAALVYTGRATLRECFPKPAHDYELHGRLFFNQLMREASYQGEVLPGRKNIKADPYGRRRRMLEERKDKLEAKLAEVRGQIAELEKELNA